MEEIEKLKAMVNKPFLYQNEEVVVLGFCDGTGEEGDEVEIYLNNGKTLVWTIGELGRKLLRFRSITNTVIVLANNRLNQVSTVNPSVIQEMRDVTLDMIRKVKENPEAVGCAKQVFQGVNTMINLAKTELEYRKYIDKKLELES